MFKKIRCALQRRWRELGVNLVDAVMTLIAFLPGPGKAFEHRDRIAVDRCNFLSTGCGGVTLGGVWNGLSGTDRYAAAGFRVSHQRVEAAYRKELVLGEDDPARATPPRLIDLFAAVRQNYFRVYLNYMYFNVGLYAVFADRQHISLHRTGTDYSGGNDHAWSDEPNSQCFLPGSIVVPVPCELVAPNCRTDFDLQTPQSL